MTIIFEPEIKDKKCKHDWVKLKNKFKGSSWFIIESKNVEVEYEYLYCPKCGSTSGDIITA